MKFPRLVPFVLLAAASPALAVADAPAGAAAADRPRSTAGTAPAAATRPAAKSIASSRTLTILPFDLQYVAEDVLDALGQRARQLGAERAGLDGREVGEWFQAIPLQNGLDLRVNLSVIVPHPKPVAAEIADALVPFARELVKSTYERDRDAALAAAERNLDRAVGPARAAEDQLKQVRQKLRELSGRSDIAPKTLTAALSSIDDEVQRLQLERLAKESRRKALEEEIAKAAERAQKNVESDPIAAELKKVVDARDEQVARMKKMHDQGTVTGAEVMQSIADAAEARAKLLQQQRDAAAAGGGTALESFNRELMTLAIDARELDTKTKYLEDRLPRLREAVEMLDEYQEIERRAGDARNALRDAQREAENTRRTWEDNPLPRVLVKDARDADPSAVVPH